MFKYQYISLNLDFSFAIAQSRYVNLVVKIGTVGLAAEILLQTQQFTNQGMLAHPPTASLWTIVLVVATLALNCRLGVILTRTLVAKK